MSRLGEKHSPRKGSRIVKMSQCQVTQELNNHYKVLNGTSRVQSMLLIHLLRAGGELSRSSKFSSCQFVGQGTYTRNLLAHCPVIFFCYLPDTKVKLVPIWLARNSRLYPLQSGKIKVGVLDSAPVHLRH